MAAATDSLVPLPTHPAGVAWPTAAWPRAELDSAVDRQALERRIDEAFRHGSRLGQTHALVIVHRGAVVAERHAPPFDASSTHLSWSMAKSWMHAMVGILVRQGKLDIHARADVPEWDRPGDPRRSITLDQLLRMRSGLHFVEDYVDGTVSTVIEMLFGAGKEDVAGFAAQSPLEHEPGSVFYYSSGTTNLIARAAQRAAGKSGEAWEAFLRRELFDPIGATSATPRFDAAGTWIASSFLYATAHDFARFGLLYLRDGQWDGRRILPEGWVDYARRESAREEDGRAYGAHFWVVPGSLGIFQCQGYDGQRTTLVPALDLVVVRLGKTDAEGADELNLFMKEVVDCFRSSAR